MEELLLILCQEFRHLEKISKRHERIPDQQRDHSLLVRESAADPAGKKTRQGTVDGKPDLRAYAENQSTPFSTAIVRSFCSWRSEFLREASCGEFYFLKSARCETRSCWIL